MEMAGLRDSPDHLRARAREGDPVAQFNMGVKYAEGRGVPQDFLEAARWYSAAADQGDAPSQFNLGLMFFQGHGLERNLAYAYELFRAAALQGDPRARSGLEAVLQEMDPQEKERLCSLLPLPRTAPVRS